MNRGFRLPVLGRGGGKAAAVPVPSIVTDGLVLEYRFDEGSGQSVTDYVGGYNAQLGSGTGGDQYDPAWTAAGLDFDGADDYITAATVPDSIFLGENGFTAILVCNVQAKPAFVQFISKNTGASGNKIPMEWRGSNALPCQMGIFRGHDTANRNWLSPMVDANLWRMYAIVCPQAIEGQPTAYVNACRYTVRPVSGSGTGAATGANRPLRIGAREDNGNRLDGPAGYALIYNRMLSQAEMEQNYQALVAIMALRGVTLPAIGTGVVFDGDSLTAGKNATFGNDYPSQCLALLGAGYDKWNIGVEGRSMEAQKNDAATYCDTALSAARSKNICMSWGGSNDIAGGQTAATVYNNRILPYVAARKTAGFTNVVVGTIIPRTDISGAKETERTTLNTSIINGAAANGYSVADIAAAANLQNFNDTTYFHTDKVHLVDAGYAVVAGIVAPVIQGL